MATSVLGYLEYKEKEKNKKTMVKGGPSRGEGAGVRLLGTVAQIWVF